MSTPSKRKFEKQRERQKKLVQKNIAAEQKAALVRQKQGYAETFPEFVFFHGNAPSGFIDVIREAVSKLNFENREQFGKRERDFFATLKSNRSREIFTRTQAHRLPWPCPFGDSDRTLSFLFGARTNQTMDSVQ